MHLAHYGVHTPMRAKSEMIAQYAKRAGERNDLPAATQKKLAATDDVELDPATQRNPIYAAMLESVDQSIDRVIQALEETDQLKQTIIVFTSDNGGLCTREGANTPATNNRPLREGKGYLYEGGIRVPLIVVDPRVAKPFQRALTSAPTKSVKAPSSAALVQGMDLYPTLIELAGLNLPTHPIDGMSFAHHLRTGEEHARTELYWDYPHYANQGGKPGSAIRAGKHKLIQFHETGRLELFDLSADQGENQNLAPSQPELAKQLADKLVAWREKLRVIPMSPNPAYRPNAPDKSGVINIPGRSAFIYGTQLRFEPLPHKNTLGYWSNVNDHVEFDVTIDQPGSYEVELTYGCGAGQGGSRIELTLAPDADRKNIVSKLPFTVVATGGWQKFVTQQIGELAVPKQGRYRLTVRAVSKPGVAVMDLPKLRLIPKKPASATN